VVGETGGDALAVRAGAEAFSAPLAELRAAHSELERFFP
jgi:hypothetical protein